MNCIKTEVYPGNNLSSNEVSFRCKEVSIQLRPKKMGRSREMRLRRIKLKNGCHERSLIFVIESRFKLKRIDEEKIRVPTGCILSIGTVPTGCILSIGTVPTGYILSVGSVPAVNLSHINIPLLLYYVLLEQEDPEDGETKGKG